MDDTAAFARLIRALRPWLGHLVIVGGSDNTIVMRPAKAQYSLKELVERITPRNRHGETSWGPPAGHESW